MNFKVVFLNKKVEKETLNFPKGILANFIHIVEMIEEFGSDLGMPYTSKVEKDLFEIRSKGSEGIGRSFFLYSKGKENRNTTFFYQENTKNSSKRNKNCQKTVEGV